MIINGWQENQNCVVGWKK